MFNNKTSSNTEKLFIKSEGNNTYKIVDEFKDGAYALTRDNENQCFVYKPDYKPDQANANSNQVAPEPANDQAQPANVQVPAQDDQALSGGKTKKRRNTNTKKKQIKKKNRGGFKSRKH
jgi:hypothetical protein